MKVIGVIGGLGPQSTALYYRVMNREVRDRLGGLHSCRMIIDSFDFEPFAKADCREAFEVLRAELVASAVRLAAAGAELIVISCNTVHRFFEDVRGAVGVAVLHIAEPLGQSLVAEGHTAVGLLGTRATMESAFYRKYLKEKFGLEVLVPERSARDTLNSMILEELQQGHDPLSCAPLVDELIEGLCKQGASAVALACTELQLVFGAPDTPIIQRCVPAFDTAILHAQAAVRWALSDLVNCDL